ncbi:MAG: NCS2 family permease [Nitrospinae bacterium]|nr:NCS2 family permease [Nitrospinota bacterium]
MGALEKLFEIEKRGSSTGKEVTAGITTFLTASYIIFVQPAVLSIAGMDFGSVMMATCIATAFATALMAVFANYPIVVAPAMGHNFFFAITVCGAAAAGGMGFHWSQALAAVFISGSIFLFLSLFGFREKIINAIPSPLRLGIAVGIGLLIALLGLEWGGVIVSKPGTFVGFGSMRSGPVLLTFFGTFLMLALMIRKVRGAILWGILGSALAALPFGLATFHGFVSAPPSMVPTFLKLDFAGLFANSQWWLVTAVFFMLALFDTVGTLVGVAMAAGLMDESGKIPRAERAMAADAGGTMAGAFLGTSTVTAYIESAAGIAVGGRTGLAALVTAGLFLLSIFFSPLAQMVGGGYKVAEGVYLYPVIAPALIVVGSLMLTLVKEISWDDPADGFSAYMAIILTPLSVSITEGVSVAFISYSLLKSAQGKFFEVPWLTHVCSVLFILRYAFLAG